MWSGTPSVGGERATVVTDAEQFIDCFYDYHRNLSPESEVWPYEDYLHYGGERLMKDPFTDGYVDHAIFQPAHLGAFYENGFGQTEEAFGLTRQHPDKLTYNHFFDPRFEQAGLDQLRRDAERFGLKGVKLHTAEWQGDSRGWKLDDPWCYKYLEACRELGIRTIHVHKGPTIRPLDRDPGAERARRARGRHAVHPHQAAVLRPDHR